MREKSLASGPEKIKRHIGSSITVRLPRGFGVPVERQGRGWFHGIEVTRHESILHGTMFYDTKWIEFWAPLVPEEKKVIADLLEMVTDRVDFQLRDYSDRQQTTKRHVALRRRKTFKLQTDA